MKEKKRKTLSTRQSLALLLRRAADFVEDRKRSLDDARGMIVMAYSLLTDARLRAKRSR